VSKPAPACPSAAATIGLAATLALTACVPEPGTDFRTVPQGNPQRGLALVARYQCGGCHAVPGAPSASVETGPPLDAYGLRSYIAGRVPNNPQTLQRWLLHPQGLVPDTAMPDLGMPPEDARDIAAYLLSLP
jgi:cytochrome c1